MDMTLAGLLSPDRIVKEMTSLIRCDAIPELLQVLVAKDELNEASSDLILKALQEREDERSTGIGNGVAIPHCFSESVERVSAIFGRSEKGIDFCSQDRAPVHFVVLFVVPQSQYALHLKTLAAIAKTLDSAQTRERLSAATSPEYILEVLSRNSPKQ